MATALAPRPRAAITRQSQKGILLLEALIGILIFSIGVLGLVGLQAKAVKQAVDAEFRSIAALAANDLISQMWVSDRTAATLQAAFASSGSGTGYSTWSTAVQASGLPGISSTNGNLPTVTFTTVAGGLSPITGVTSASSSRATITVFWRSPGETADHQYVVTAQMKP